MTAWFKTAGHVVALASTCAISAGATAHAATLPGATFSKNLTAFSTTKGYSASSDETTGLSSEGSGDSGAYAILNARIADGPIPFVETSTQSHSMMYSDTSPGTAANGTASAVLKYYLRVGGGLNEPVSVLVYARGEVSSYQSPGEPGGYANAGGSAIVSLSIFGNDEYLVNKSVGCGGPRYCGHTLSVFQRMDFIANLEYLVTISAMSTTSAANGAGSSNSAYLDPYFALEGDAARTYTIELSEGIGNGAIMSPVPLPSSAPLFGAALAALGAVGYRLRRKAGSAALVASPLRVG